MLWLRTRVITLRQRADAEVADCYLFHLPEELPASCIFVDDLHGECGKDARNERGTGSVRGTVGQFTQESGLQSKCPILELKSPTWAYLLDRPYAPESTASYQSPSSTRGRS
jgi:hypothetical protein